MKGRVLMCHELPGISVPLDSLWEHSVALVSFLFCFVSYSRVCFCAEPYLQIVFKL